MQEKVNILADKIDVFTDHLEYGILLFFICISRIVATVIILGAIPLFLVENFVTQIIVWCIILMLGLTRGIWGCLRYHYIK